MACPCDCYGCPRALFATATGGAALEVRDLDLVKSFLHRQPLNRRRTRRPGKQRGALILSNRSCTARRAPSTTACRGACPELSRKQRDTLILPNRSYAAIQPLELDDGTLRGTYDACLLGSECGWVAAKVLPAPVDSATSSVSSLFVWCTDPSMERE
jgi:hypothetical protein